MKKVSVFLFSVLFAITAFAQDNNMSRAQQLLQWVINGKGDSILCHVNNNVRSHVTADMFNNTFAQMQQQFGPLLSTGTWESKEIPPLTVYYCNLVFKNMSLRFLTAFDKDGLANTIRLAPAPINEQKSTDSTTVKKLNGVPVTIQCDTFKLPGVLNLPTINKKRFPLVILIQGSGPSDRDEAVYGNKPFYDIAEGLINKGVAVLRYDKRTFVYGTNYVPQNGKADFDAETVNDALAAIKLAHTLPQVDPNHIYVLGHSLGGMLAPRIAERSGNLKGIIIMAGNARPLEDMIKEQTHYIASIEPNLPDDTKKQITELDIEIGNIKNIGTPAFNDKLKTPLNVSISYWEAAKEYHQTAVAQKLKLPMLFLQGERDYQVTMTDFNLWKKALKSHTNVHFISYPDLNHLMQTGVGKSVPAEYMKVGGHVSSAVINDIANFVLHN
jgi:uncharacterized protein